MPATAKKQKQATMGQFFKPMEPKNQTLLTKFFKSSNSEENKFQYLFEREEARRKKIEQEQQEKIEKEREEQRRVKREAKQKKQQEEKEKFEADQEMRWEAEKLKHEGKQIIPGLFLGSRHAAKNIQWINGHVTSILNVSQEVKNYFEGHFVNSVCVRDETPKSNTPCLLKYQRIVCQDSIDENLSKYFMESVAFIDSVIKSGGAVLVHCREGLSRSPSTVIAYLMEKERWSLSKAYEHVLECNKKLRINDGFKRQLMQFEFSLFNENSVDFFEKRTTRSSHSRSLRNSSTNEREQTKEENNEDKENCDNANTDSQEIQTTGATCASTTEATTDLADDKPSGGANAEDSPVVEKIEAVERTGEVTDGEAMNVETTNQCVGNMVMESATKGNDNTGSLAPETKLDVCEPCTTEDMDLD